MKNNEEKKANFFVNLKIGGKLALGFIIITAFIIVVSFFSIKNFNNVSYEITILSKAEDADYKLALARIEQAKFEADRTEETSKKVKEYIEISIKDIEEAKILMKSEENKKKSEEMLSSIKEYEKQFMHYADLEAQKKEQGKVRTTAGGDMISAISEMVSRAEYSMKESSNLSETQLIFNHYLLFKKILTDSMEVKIAANKYAAKYSVENANKVREYIGKMEKGIVDLKKGTIAQDVIEYIDRAYNGIITYKKSFEEYSSMVEAQEKARTAMETIASESAEKAEAIRDGVLSYIEDIKNSSQKVNIIIPVAAVLLSIVIAYLITRSITAPMRVVRKSLDNIAGYDLTEEIPSRMLIRKDEIGDLSKSTKQIGDSLKVIVDNISSNASDLSASSQELSSTSNVTSTAAFEVSKAITEISEGATQQAKNTEEGAFSISELGELIEDDRKYVEELVNSADQVNQLKNEGIEIIKSLVSDTNKSSESSRLVTEIVQDTDVSAKKIQEASNMIQSISDQTNLLALNAAIEAARAGEAGKGFAVVADEIRKLAEDAKNFTEEISATILDLISKVSRAVETMEVAKNVVESQTISVNMTNEKFNGIALAVEKMQDVIETIKESSVEMEKKKVEMIDVMQNLSSISEENAAGTEEAAATVEEQTAAIEEISRASDQLAELADEMQGVISKFRT